MDRQNKEEHFLAEIATDFIEEFSRLYKKHICAPLKKVDIKLLCERNKEIHRLHALVVRHILIGLQNHRHNPVSAKFLFKLDSCEYLPKSIRIVLDSINWHVPKEIKPGIYR